MWILIIFTALLPHSYHGGGNLTPTSVPGFTSYQACVNAGNEIRIPGDVEYFTTKVTFACVKTDV